MYDNVLLPTDGSVGVDRAIDHAIDAADRYDATLHVLYVVDSDVVNAYSGDEFVDGAEGAEETLEETGREALDAVAERARDAGVETATALRYGVPHEEILRYADEEDVDLTVMGSKTRSGDYRRMLGSVTERVSRQSPAPVSIVKTTVDA
ncbi:Nucleotide-binding universal stress protein, UspA family [Halorubrum xinjiangense]|uniref:Nucleotide-binding universal stress protein, UspA family n=1 Tax=Halorubrum xinjiangense TaxID=261291 RepID=A0A1G7LPQ8_9EURY|nr:universal stress protein [Halorubrum xinjiangense]SDF50939.1 Nucleotide-binding universal stress protein, UspA family [Halorubrum xinjiangense]